MKVKSAYKLKCDFDWNAYSTLFPTRYLKESRLDFELHKIVSDISLRLSWIKTEVKILDVGGGPQFTPALRRMILKIFEKYPDCDMILHSHNQLAGSPNVPYLFPGTTEETCH